MYWWNASALAEDLRQKRVSQREQAKYLVATMSLVTLFLAFQLPAGDEVHWMFPLAQALVTTIITVVGIFSCHEANRRGDDEAFIARYICLGWTVGVRTVVWTTMLYAPVAVVLALVPQVRAIDLVRHHRLAEFALFGVVCPIRFFLLTRSLLLRVAGARV